MIKTILGVIGIILLADFAFLLMWLASGQVPPSSFYFGAISANIIRLVLGF